MTKYSVKKMKQKLRKGVIGMVVLGLGISSVPLTLIHAQGKTVSNITLNITKKTIKVGDKIKLKATVKPKKAKMKKVVWKTSNKKVATVSKSGVVTAKRSGTAKITAMATDGSNKKAVCKITVKKVKKDPQYEGYHLVWKDEFNGDSLNFEDWQYEPHEPGWVNNELQEYTTSTDNVYVKNGKLVIQAIKKSKDGNTTYTSGKVTTQNKRDFKYGRIEASIKVPEGQGLWPAFWMMPTEQEFYGEWPKCGEIDIMEVLGHETNKLYGTIHYGNPHKESQGTYTLTDKKFSDDYHLYAVEWEPGSIKFYIDNVLYHEAKDWYTCIEGDDEVTFPAPFDQTFFLQFNLAVGGSWPGNPDETTDFSKAKLMVDYVKVYQKDDYDENVEKIEKEPVILRDADENGNYVINGNFAEQEDLNDEQNWKFLLAGNGDATATIKNNTMRIETKDAGNLDYSVQLVQPNLPMKQGGVYRLTFDAKADEARTMIVGISAPDHSYIRYMEDTKVDITTSMQKYTYEFTMTKEDDANGRLEYNLGNQGSIAGIEIQNVKLEKIDEIEVNKETLVLSNGNFIHNGTFDVGKDRLGYWQFIKNENANASIEVTNEDYKKRELKVTVNDVKQLEDVKIEQDVPAIAPNTTYILSFDGYADKANNIKATLLGQEFKAALTKKKQRFEYQFTTGETVEESTKKLQVLLGNKGITYIDNIMLREKGLLLNGSFNLGTVGWELYTYDSNLANYLVETDEKEGKVAKIAIDHTGNTDWYIQLKQSDLTLEKDKCYRISVRAKADKDRTVQFALQENGGDWIPYSDTLFWDLTGEYQTFTKTFKMTHETDHAVGASLTMGAVKGKEILEPHNIYVSSILLEEISEEELK